MSQIRTLGAMLVMRLYDGCMYFLSDSPMQFYQRRRTPRPVDRIHPFSAHRKLHAEMCRPCFLPASSEAFPPCIYCA